MGFEGAELGVVPLDAEQAKDAATTAVPRPPIWPVPPWRGCRAAGVRAGTRRPGTGGAHRGGRDALRMAGAGRPQRAGVGRAFLLRARGHRGLHDGGAIRVGAGCTRLGGVRHRGAGRPRLGRESQAVAPTGEDPRQGRNGGAGAADAPIPPELNIWQEGAGEQGRSVGGLRRGERLLQVVVHGAPANRRRSPGGGGRRARCGGGPRDGRTAA